MGTRRLAWIVVTVAFALCGCHYSYHFDISGMVKSASGEPLGGVTIVLDPDGHGSGRLAEFQSEPDGTFSYEMRIREYEFDNGRLPTRVLWFSKPGYVKEKVDISPKQKPNSFKEHLPVVVHVTLRRSEQKP
jgi:hypothetical protein